MIQKTPLILLIFSIFLSLLAFNLPWLEISYSDVSYFTGEPIIYKQIKNKSISVNSPVNAQINNCPSISIFTASRFTQLTYNLIMFTGLAALFIQPAIWIRYKSPRFTALFSYLPIYIFILLVSLIGYSFLEPATCCLGGSHILLRNVSPIWSTVLIGYHSIGLGFVSILLRNSQAQDINPLAQSIFHKTNYD